jgi:hypothetical protein
MRSALLASVVAKLIIACSFVTPIACAQPQPDLSPQAWIEIGPEKAVIARHSKSADGRHALAWIVNEPASVDWSLLKTDPDGFYQKYELREIWVVDLSRRTKLSTLGSSVGYVRPGSHRTLSVTWGPLENGRRFALVTYDWKWGTDALILLDIGADNCREAQIGSIVDRSVNALVKQKAAKRATYDIKYSVAELPEHGLKTGFSDPATVRVPFAAKIRGRDRTALEGIVSLSLLRRDDAPLVKVMKATAGSIPDDPFSDDRRLAKADQELNAVYLALCKRLDHAAEASLRAEEHSWIEQREKQAADLKSDSTENGRIIRDQTLRRLTEERTAELRKRLESPGH